MRRAAAVLAFVGALSVQQLTNGPLAAGQSASVIPPKTVPDQSAAAADVLTFEREMEAAVVRGDVAFLDRVIPADFSFTHGDGWTTGDKPLKVDDRVSWLTSIGQRPYLWRDLDSVKVEMHGDVAITYGRYVAKNRAGDPGRQQFEVWFERVYARRSGRWQYLSHRTVHGPTYAVDRTGGAR